MVAGDRTLLVEAWYPADISAQAAADAGHPIAEFVPMGPQRDMMVALLAKLSEHGQVGVREQTRSARDAASAGTGPYPLVMFSHCHGCVRFSMFTIAEHLASHGFVVVAPDHAGNTLFDEPQAPLDEAFLQVRVADQSAVLDAVLDAGNSAVPEAIRGAIDPARIGAMGHSYGAATAGRLAQEDDRIVAALPIAAPVQNPIFSGTKLAEIDEPQLFVLAAEDNSIGKIGNQLIESNFDAAATPAYLVRMKDTGHWGPTDICGLAEQFDAGCGPGRGRPTAASSSTSSRCRRGRSSPPTRPRSSTTTCAATRRRSSSCRRRRRPRWSRSRRDCSSGQVWKGMSWGHALRGMAPGTWCEGHGGVRRGCGKRSGVTGRVGPSRLAGATGGSATVEERGVPESSGPALCAWAGSGLSRCARVERFGFLEKLPRNGSWTSNDVPSRPSLAMTGGFGRAGRRGAGGALVGRVFAGHAAAHGLRTARGGARRRDPGDGGGRAERAGAVRPALRDRSRGPCVSRARGGRVRRGGVRGAARRHGRDAADRAAGRGRAGPRRQGGRPQPRAAARRPGVRRRGLRRVRGPDALVARVLAEPAARAAAVALVRGPAREVQLGEGRVTARLSAAQLAETTVAEALLASLRALAAAMAVPKDMPTRGELVRRRSVGHIFVIAFAWLVTLGLAVLLRPPQVLAWGPVFGALGLGGLLWLVVLVPLGLILRGAPDSLRWFTLSAAAFLLTTPFAGMKLALWANAALDRGPEVAVRLPVQLVDRSETLVLVDVVGLEVGRTSTRLAVPMDRVLGTLPKAPGSLILTKRPGALGWPWLVDLRP
ncbi:alpha/beta hydrolase family protein [Nannocystis pusilla]|uniref:alpha/beta hydrolase family protein n=1 Tax=Nannocystis pusilla TaxID=889268 RepID=UPI003B770678